jgi:large subunit ribosomal protein L18
MVRAEIVGDKVLVCADSGELARKYGWLGNRSNLPAAYLTGLLCGYKALASGVKEAVLDIGLQSPTKGARIFAALKGVLDAGVLVPYEESILPSEERIRGQHIVAYAKRLASNPEMYQARFSEHLSRGLPPEQLAEHFLSVKEKIASSFKKKKTEEKEAKARAKPKPKPKRRVSKKRRKGEVGK